jgi:nitrate/TMAO reductase-like tetraheme cytochrome c subunit
MMMLRFITAYILFIALMAGKINAQISPGELTEAHAHLEGMSNCTQCHILGDKVSNDKCLKCHAELKGRIDLNKGYHASQDVRSKECVVCHNDHHGRNFQIVRFSEETFNHDLTGYKLAGAHAGKTCKSCHKPEFITNPEIKSKKYTYLGLDPACLTCHDDYHQGSLSDQCANCHGFNKFTPAENFDHSTSKFPLAGKHAGVDCVKCHKVTTRNGKDYQEFRGIPFSNCTSCHADVHQNQFGQDCRQCHSEESFHMVKGMEKFDHNRTAFPLEGKHQAVNCKACHKTNLTDPLNHNRCMDCHSDYHRGQFIRQDISPDCSACHGTAGFNEFSYTVEQHNAGTFRLEGSHLATPCFDCHKKTDRWEFRNIGLRCIDCHKDVHLGVLDTKFYPGNNCTNCHNEEAWGLVRFDHSQTRFPLEGKHGSQSCRACHFKKDESGQVRQRFAGLSADCAVCHNDTHRGQFIEKGIADCRSCHAFENWRAVKFDHSKTRFKLDGKHAGLACQKCHKEVTSGEVRYIQYTYQDFKCETCHH